MARSENANTTSTVEKNETVEELGIIVETTEEVVETDEQQENTSVKNGSGNVLVFNKSLINKSVVLPTRTITFNDKGLCEVTEVEAKRLLTIPGYSLKK